MNQTVNVDRVFLSNFQIIRALKRKKLIDQSTPDFSELPSDPDKRIILVQVDPKFLLESQRDKHFSLNSKEIRMNYMEMAEAVKQGKKARRSSWPESMRLWFASEMMLHTHPYWPDQGRVVFKDDKMDGFPYICEKDDALTNDWELISA